MSYKRIIPCLDVKDGRVVKGVNFVDFKDAGDPVECARAYDAQGADELVFLDITASADGRDILLELVKRVADAINIPFAVGGGVRTTEDIRRVLDAGADKVCIGTAAVGNPDLIAQAAAGFGSGRIVAAIDVKRMPDGGYHVYTKGGREDTGLDALEWARRAESLGAGEILLTSMDRDGCKDGFDLEITSLISAAAGIPVTASGGAGTKEHFYEAFAKSRVGAALAASLFHFGELEIPELKRYLREMGVQVRL